MSHLKFSKNVLEKFCKDAFGKFGFSVEESSIITDVLITADMYGIESHGMQRLSRYHKGIESGRIHPDGRLEIVFETPVSAVFDGHNGMGQLILYNCVWCHGLVFTPDDCGDIHTAIYSLLSERGTGSGGGRASHTSACRGGTNDKDNLISLCKSCHNRIHAKRGDRWHNKTAAW